MCEYVTNATMKTGICRILDAVSSDTPRSDEFVSTLCLLEGCGRLQTINLSSCQDITDIGVSALDLWCGQLYMADLRGCWDIPDTCVSVMRVRVSVRSHCCKLITRCQ